MEKRIPDIDAVLVRAKQKPERFIVSFKPMRLRKNWKQNSVKVISRTNVNGEQVSEIEAYIANDSFPIHS